MIRSFKHKGIAKLFTKADRSLLDPKHVSKIQRILLMLDIVTNVLDMDIPGYGLHQLLGNRKGTWSVKISGNLRITFDFEKGHAFDVNLEDYH